MMDYTQLTCGTSDLADGLGAVPPAPSTNETECDGAYDRICRDPRDNCPTEGAVLQREWRHKTATIAMLEMMILRFGVSNAELHDTLRNLYMVLRDRHYGRMPDEVQAAYDKAGTLLRKYET